MTEWDKLEGALTDVQNILGEMVDARERNWGSRIRTEIALMSAEDLARQVAKLREEDEPRDEAYERAAAKYDGKGKDWR
jgi:hypothetical protein